MADIYGNKAFAAAFSLFVVLLAVFAVLQSSFFQLERLELEGAARLTEADIFETTGLKPGDNLFSFNLRAAEEALAGHPLIAQVEVRRRIPAALGVRVIEREPVAQLATQDGFWHVDYEGTVLFHTSVPESARPLITLDGPVEVHLGDVPDHPQLRPALRFAIALSPRVRTEISEIHGSEVGILAYTQDGITVQLGRDEEMEEKGRILERLLEEVANRSMAVSQIDLRHPTSPVLREKR